MEHYQATNTPRGSASHNMSTPPGNKCNLNGMDEANLPQELSELCNHQCKVGQVHLCSILLGAISACYLIIYYLLQLAFCREAMTHLQEMKDELIAVANELLDDDGELNPQHSQELRKKRFDSYLGTSALPQ